MSQAQLFLLPLRHKPNRPLAWIGWRHQLADGVEDLFELSPRVVRESVVLKCERFGLSFQLFEPFGEVAVRGRQFAYPHEGPHDFDVDSDGARATEHR